jgi:nucleoside-diphosphate-sugar epimerase
VANLIIQMTESSSSVVFEDPLVFLTSKGIPNLTLAKDELGWIPLVSLKDGLQKTIDYAIANKEALGLNYNI